MCNESVRGGIIGRRDGGLVTECNIAGLIPVKLCSCWTYVIEG